MNIPVIVAAALVASIVAGGLLVAGVAMLVRIRAFDAPTRHQLWFAALVAIALLPLVGIAASVVHAVRLPSSTSAAIGAAAPAQAVSARTPSSPAGDAAPRGRASTTDAAAAKGSSLPPFVVDAPAGLALTALAIVALIALTGLAGLGLSVARVRAVKLRSSPLDEQLSEDLPWLTETHRGRETYLRLSYEIEAPVAVGFRRPVILIPTDLATRGGLDAIEDLVIHEHAHLRRYDDYTNLVQRTIERVYWFNPFVWIVGRQIALQREIAADDAVVARTADRTRYADALWRLAKEMRMPAHALVAPGALFTRKQISVRIEALLAPGRERLRRLGPASAASAVAVGLMSCAIVAFAAPPLELPAPPSPPSLAALPAAPAMPAAPATPASPAAAAAPAPALHEDVRALTTLSNLISTRLADLKATLQARHAITAREAAGVHHEAALLRDKLAVMQHMAQGAPLPELQHRIAALQGAARSLDDTVSAQGMPASGRVAVQPIHVDVPQIHVSVPFVDVDVPAVHVDVPRVQVDVPPVNVNVPRIHVRVPASAAAAPVAPAAPPAMVADQDESDPSNVHVTRELLERCTGCDLAHRDLRNLDLHGLTLTGVDLSHADLRGVNLSGANLSGTDLSGANLDGADLTNARLTGADIGGASFRGTKMDGIRLSGVSLRRGAFDVAGLRAILTHGCTGCDLSHMDLRGIDLHGLTLEGADLSHSDLTGANLAGAHLTGVSLDHVKLDNADLRGATLTGCSMRGTSLGGAHLEGISLSGSSLGE